ncbi:hypothetical protein R3P38DRAFT_3294134 [Favolaschia claudopus]|uniref:Uncharacterized protein n=1 Tax=Favolaschia claudopus TaxID=2862362 RepID=A0AAV9ZF56_9AGAR
MTSAPKARADKEREAAAGRVGAKACVPAFVFINTPIFFFQVFPLTTLVISALTAPSSSPAYETKSARALHHLPSCTPHASQKYDA